MTATVDIAQAMLEGQNQTKHVPSVSGGYHTRPQSTDMFVASDYTQRVWGRCASYRPSVRLVLC